MLPLPHCKIYIWSRTRPWSMRLYATCYTNCDWKANTDKEVQKSAFKSKSTMIRAFNYLCSSIEKCVTVNGMRLYVSMIDAISQPNGLFNRNCVHYMLEEEIATLLLWWRPYCWICLWNYWIQGGVKIDKDLYDGYLEPLATFGMTEDVVDLHMNKWLCWEKL